LTFFKKLKKTQQTAISQCTVILSYFCCNIHHGRDALNYFGRRQVTEFSQQLAILNPTRSDFKYPSDFRFLKNAGFRRIRMQVRNPSVTSLVTNHIGDSRHYPAVLLLVSDVFVLRR